MVTAGDNKIWIWILFAIGSVVYNFLKKRKQKSENSAGIDSPQQQRAQSNWSVNDLIQQFEKNYGQSEPVKSAMEEEYKAEQYFDSSNPETLQPTKEPLKSNSTTHLSKDTAVENRNEDFYDLNKTEQEYESEDLDLRSMVVHNAILNRPKF